MIIHTRDIYTEINMENDLVLPDYNSLSSITSDNYFESIIRNCIQFFNEDYLFSVPFIDACNTELDRLLRYPGETNNIGRLIYTTYYSALSKGKREKDLRDFIIDNFFAPKGTTSFIRSLHSAYTLHKSIISVLFQRFGLRYGEFDRLAKIIDTIIVGRNCDFSPIGINCKVYRSADFTFDIAASSLYQIAMEYDAIIMSHNVPNKNIWEIEPIEINDKWYRNIDECLNALQEKNILVLVCNDNGHDLMHIPNKIITIPKHALISELYIEK